MEGKTAGATDSLFRDTLQRVASCVTSAIFIGRLNYPPEMDHAIRLSETPAPLSGNDGLRLAVAMRYTMTQSTAQPPMWRLHTRAYSYRLLTRDGKEIVLYQWDPASYSPVHELHLHIGRGMTHPSLPIAFRQQISSIAKAHLPTGAITVPAILRAAIRDLGVTPRRDDWSEVLATADAALRFTLPSEAPHVRR